MKAQIKLTQEQNTLLAEILKKYNAKDIDSLLIELKSRFGLLCGKKISNNISSSKAYDSGTFEEFYSHVLKIKEALPSDKNSPKGQKLKESLALAIEVLDESTNTDKIKLLNDYAEDWRTSMEKEHRYKLRKSLSLVLTVLGLIIILTSIVTYLVLTAFMPVAGIIAVMSLSLKVSLIQMAIGLATSLIGTLIKPQDNKEEVIIKGLSGIASKAEKHADTVRSTGASRLTMFAQPTNKGDHSSLEGAVKPTEDSKPASGKRISRSPSYDSLIGKFSVQNEDERILKFSSQPSLKKTN